MKRMLSLALALVLVLGLMPMAMAAKTTEYFNGSDTSTDCGHNNWSTAATETVSATCKQEGYSVYTCTHPLDNDETCPITKKVYTDKLNHVFDENGVCTAEGCGAKASEVYTVTMSDKQLTMAATDDALAMNIVVKNNETNTNAEYSVSEWSSSNIGVATVDSTGALNLIAPGTTSISAKVTVNGWVFSVSASLSVTNEATIVCTGDLVERYSTGAYIQLVPSLSDKNVTGVTWSYSTTSTTVTVDQKGRVYARNAGAATISITAKWGTPERTETTTVDVAFYDKLDATAIVKTNVSSFMFDDTDVFSTITLDSTTVANPRYYSLNTIWAGLTYDGIELSQSSTSATYGKITNTSSALLNTYNPNGTNRFDSRKESYLMFTCLNKGTFTLDYTLYSNGLMVRYGSIDIKVTEGSSDITYSTSFNKAITLNENDFYKYWNKSSNKSKLDYVVFNDLPTIGTLTVDSTKSAVDVSTSMYFNYDYNAKVDTGVRDYDLDTLYYTPYSKATKAYEETLTFTCYGETASETLSGVITIKVGANISFTDVTTADYFYDAVVWAVNEGVTTGATSTTFAPNLNCDRSQVVTFLWRAAGEPAPTTKYMPFTDVDKDDYYYDAVLWAVENGITEGTSKTTFSPKMTVTRSQVVTFLWRAMGERTVSSVNPFTDIKTSEYYYDAVLWAVKNDITEGMGNGKFCPDLGCTRAQIVTFLYRAYNG